MKTFELERLPEYRDLAKNGSVVVFDTETTGLSNDDEVVQLAVVKFHKGEEQFAKAVYLRNSVPVDGTAAAVNGLTDAILREKGLDPKEVLEDFLVMLGETVLAEGKVLLVAHNLSFDMRMMNNMFRRYGLSGFPKKAIGCCTKEFVKALALPPEVLPSNHLRTCIEHLEIKGVNSHDALDDAKACAELFKFLVD